MEFNVGDKVQLKKEFYKDYKFKDMPSYKKAAIGKLNGKELTIDSICRPDFCVKIGDTHVYTDFLKKVTKPVVRICHTCVDEKKSITSEPCVTCLKADWQVIDRPLWHSATEKPVEKAAEPSIKVGDWVQAKTSSSHGNVIKGEKYQVIGFGHTNEWLYIRTKEKSDLFSIPERNIGQPFGLLKTDTYIKCATPEPQYREVKRVAKPGDKVKIVKCEENSYKVGDVFTIVENIKHKYNDFPYYKDEDGCYLYPQEYVVLEPMETVVNNSLNLKVGDRVSSKVHGAGTVLKTDHNNDCPYWIKFDDGVFGSFYADGRYTYQNPIDSPYNIKRIIQPTKRVYTAEQIAEANRLSKRLLCECFDKGISITWHKNGFDVISATKYERFKQTEFSAKCSANDEFNLAVGKMVAICKACAEPMPKWVHGA